jgi:hypothetical protein
MPKIVPINSVNYSEYVYIYRNDSYNSSPLTGLSSSTNGLKFYYHKRRTAGTGVTLVSQTSGGPWFSAGFVELDSANLPGYYRIDIPNEVFNTAYSSDITTVVISGAANMQPVILTYQLEPSISMASVGIYNKILTSSEILLDYISQRGRFDAKKSYVALGSIGNPASNGYELKLQSPDLPSGYYYIKSPLMSSSLYMYVDMTNDGGGFDFYPIANGFSVGSVQEANSGAALGLDLVYPRSKGHWKAMYEFVTNVLGSSAAVYLQTTGAVYNTTAGNYTTSIMRDPTYYGTGATGWRVPDGGRWWLRDTTYQEPNGDYTPYSFLSLQSISSDGTLNGFNDQNIMYTGNSYLVSTNTKP